MAYRKGDSVRVKVGVKDPDIPELEIGGWQGRVSDLTHANDAEEPTIGLTWDSVTLKAMPEWVVINAARQGLSWAEMYLDVADVEPAKPRDLERDVAAQCEKMEPRYRWLDLGPEGENIQAVVNSAKSFREWDVLAAWRRSLGAILTFPFPARVDEFQERGPLRGGDKVNVLGFCDVLDDLYGVLVRCRKGRRIYDFPLANLAADDDNSVNAEPIHDYRVLHANR